MTNSHKKKRKRSKLRRWRENNKSLNCKSCGKPLKDTIHHFYCNKCHEIEKLKEKVRRGISISMKEYFSIIIHVENLNDNDILKINGNPYLAKEIKKKYKIL